MYDDNVATGGLPLTHMDIFLDWCIKTTKLEDQFSQNLHVVSQSIGQPRSQVWARP